LFSARFLPGFNEIPYLIPYLVLLLNELSHADTLIPDNLHHIYPTRQSADINGGVLFGDFLLQELLTAGIVDATGAVEWGIDSDVICCWIRVNGKGVDGLMMVVYSDRKAIAICGFINNTTVCYYKSRIYTGEMDTA